MQEQTRPTRAQRDREPAATAQRGGGSGAANMLLELGATAGNQAVASLMRQRDAQPSLPLVQRQHVPTQQGGTPAGQQGGTQAATATPATYTVGGVVYQDSQWNVAVNQVASLWTNVGGIISKRKEAVAEFAGPGGAAAAANPSLSEALLTAAITAAVAAATDGVGVLLAGSLSTGVTAIARRLPIDPAIVIARGNQIVTAAVNAGKTQANQRIPQAIQRRPTASPTGGTPLATSLATYHSAMNETLDAEGTGSQRQTLQDLLNLGDDPAGAKWAVADAIHNALSTTLDAAKRAEWNSVSDGWFGMQVQSGAGQMRGYDTGIVVIDLSNGKYPTDRLRADGAYLGGEGANDATMGMYNGRKLGEINLPFRIVMDSGSMGRGWVDCGWQIYKPSYSATPVNFHHITRWGLPWLAAKALQLRDIDTDDSRVTGPNVLRGSVMVWDEIKDSTITELGGSFHAMGMTSGVGASPF